VFGRFRDEATRCCGRRYLTPRGKRGSAINVVSADSGVVPEGQQHVHKRTPPLSNIKFRIFAGNFTDAVVLRFVRYCTASASSIACVFNCSPSRRRAIVLQLSVGLEAIREQIAVILFGFERFP